MKKINKKRFPDAKIGDTIIVDGDECKITGESKGLFLHYWVLLVTKEAERPKEEQAEPGSDDSSFATSAAVAYATDSALLGHLAGGNIVGGIVGEALREDSQPDFESAPAQDPTPTILESPDPSPSYDPPGDSSPSIDSPSDSSSFDNSGTC